MDIVEQLTQQSMQAVVDEVKALPDYDTNGEVRVELIYKVCDSLCS